MTGSTKEITSDSLVTDIVTGNYRAAEVFRKYEIDFCCGGKMPLMEICKLKGLNETSILQELEELSSTYQNAEQWPVNFMIDYLINIHHFYFEHNVPIALEYINRFTASHIKKFQEMERLPVLAGQLSGKLNDLVHYESDRLFPYIKGIFTANNNQEGYGASFGASFHKLFLEDLTLYHSQIRVIIAQIENITGNFSFPERACTTHKVMLQKLRELINYTKRHLSFENRILLPAIVQIEKNFPEKYPVT